MPLFSLLLWVKPITDHLLRSLTTLSFSHTVMQQPSLLALITVSVELLSTQIGTLRLLSCLLVVLLRISLTRWNLQVYLNSAQDKLDRFNREPGQTSNKEVQRLVASIFYCLNLVALQWITPTILLLSFVCLYKNTAGLCWLPFGAQPSPSSTISPNPTLEQSRDFVGSSDTYSWTATLLEARVTFNQLVACFSTRGVAISRGVFGFLVWWCLFALQSVSLLGLAYHRFTSDH
ncbi:Transmembrane protein 161B [Clonorchis sinensis]|nr:Transmembrane protein 161B [Clonorchis sinensis]